MHACGLIVLAVVLQAFPLQGALAWRFAHVISIMVRLVWPRLLPKAARGKRRRKVHHGSIPYPSNIIGSCLFLLTAMHVAAAAPTSNFYAKPQIGSMIWFDIFLYLFDMVLDASSMITFVLSRDWWFFGFNGAAILLGLLASSTSSDCQTIVSAGQASLKQNEYTASYLWMKWAESTIEAPVAAIVQVYALILPNTMSAFQCFTMLASCFTALRSISLGFITGCAMQAAQNSGHDRLMPFYLRVYKGMPGFRTSLVLFTSEIAFRGTSIPLLMSCLSPKMVGATLLLDCSMIAWSHRNLTFFELICAVVDPGSLICWVGGDAVRGLVPLHGGLTLNGYLWYSVTLLRAFASFACAVILRWDVIAELFVVSSLADGRWMEVLENPRAVCRLVVAVVCGISCVILSAVVVWLGVATKIFVQPVPESVENLDLRAEHLAKEHAEVFSAHGIAEVSHLDM